MSNGLPQTIAILGAGNLGQAMAQGWLDRGQLPASQLILTRHRTGILRAFTERGVSVTADNLDAVSRATILILAVKPDKVEEVIKGILPRLREDHILVSAATGISIANMRTWSKGHHALFRAMPNTAVAIGESLTCLAGDPGANGRLDLVEELFNRVGKCVRITEDLMNAATVLGACGIAYALRFVRAMQQGGIEIGFDSDTAALIANQTVRGAATILLEGNAHAEAEIDKVTTPKGCTIAGLNEMEHQGFSSSLIKGILTSYGKIG